MYYAPWDAESQSARKQFEFTAKHMEKYVSFLAVNCWHPNGECRNKYNKVYGWPVLIAYPTHGSGIQYNGPIIAEYMIKFLINLCWPLKRQPINNNLIDFQDVHYKLVIILFIICFFLGLYNSKFKYIAW